MPIPYLPIAVFGLAGGAYFANRRRNRPIDPATRATREALFAQAMNGNLSPVQYREMSKAFRAQGMNPHADMLEKRARLAEASPEVKAARRAAFRAGMTSTNVAGIRALADAHEFMGAQGCADKLREYAGALEQARHDPNFSRGGDGATGDGEGA